MRSLYFIVHAKKSAVVTAGLPAKCVMDLCVSQSLLKTLRDFNYLLYILF